ncbi:MAG TPA: ABC transporter ATP-binding protein [Actinomycetes bacterium]|nr:ABC transporter ATP-binding protein [Actinomycetes bacterium]
MPQTARASANWWRVPSSPPLVEERAGALGGQVGSEAGPLAVFRDVGVRLGATPVLRAVDLEVAPGQAVGLVGANGSGKTTLLRVLATLLPPTSGCGTVLGAPLDSPARFAVRPAITLLGHVPALYPQLTLEENLQMMVRLLGERPGQAARALEVVGLAGARHRRAGHCSQGMLRRAELARALIARPRLLLLDEAHAGLDPAASELVELLVAEVRGRGGAAVLVSHEPRRLRPLVDRTVELADGRLRPVQEAADAE